MLVSPVQFLNARGPITVTLEGMVMEVRLVQSEKAFSPILVTVDGIVIFVISLQLENPFAAIAVTGRYASLVVGR